MNAKYVITDMKDALRKKEFPEVTVWNRLEGRPRTHNFDRALKAEIHDALWMLTRQYQMGEFFGDDAGSPVLAKMHLAKSQFTHYRPEGHTWQPFEENAPLEAQVERRPIPFRQFQRVMENESIKLVEQKFSLDLRLLMGRQWIKLLRHAGFDDGPTATLVETFIKDNRYSVKVPDPTNPEDAHLCAHPEVWAVLAAVAGRCMDGAELYLYLKMHSSNRASDGIASLDPNQTDAIDTLGTRFIEWVEKLFYQPSGSEQDAWLPDRLEYQFAVSVQEGTNEKVFSAEEYYQGQLDWFNFDMVFNAVRPGSTDPSGVVGQPSTVTRSSIPTQVVFEGMPNTRWWAFEDQRTNFGDIKPDTTDIAKLLLMEFGLVYANDWCLIPITVETWMPTTSVPEGHPYSVNNHISASVFNVKGMMVTNVFGERFWIKAAGSDKADAWQHWSMFTLKHKGNPAMPDDHSLLLLPTASKVQEGKPYEQVVLIRDELANMVWAIEKIVPLASGHSKRGAEASHELREFLEKPLREKITQMKTRRAELEKKAENERTLSEKEELAKIVEDLTNILLPTPAADIRYQVMNTVPEYWIPFIPVNVTGSNREIQLQRATILRTLEGDPKHPQKIRPRTSLLREGLDQQSPAAYYIHEEEVPRAGIQVSQSFHRARHHDGRVWLWLGVKKQTGRGEGSSGLAFDQTLSVDMA